MNKAVAEAGSLRYPSWVSNALLPWICVITIVLLVCGCAHRVTNQPVSQYQPQDGYRGRNFVSPEKDDQILLLLTFSGGGTRAAAFSYGVLETLRDTAVSVHGQQRRLLDQVSWISGVSGGSFTAAYYGLYGDRTFEDFETRFLKKNVERDLVNAVLFNPVNWVKFFSGFYGRSDLAAEYYDKHLFDGKKFGDILARRGPFIIINATDMVNGTRISFVQEAFDSICSNLVDYPVASACAASSAVPVILTPITLRNYAGQCGYRMPKALTEAMEHPRDVSLRRLHLANNIMTFLDSQQKPYIHLVDGGVADNLGLRAVLERVTLTGDAWSFIKSANLENVHKVVFVVVNAETEVDNKWNRFAMVPPFGAMLESYSSIAISRYNVETVALLEENFHRWADEIRRGRCGTGPISTEPGSCGDIEFYLVQVRFDSLDDQAESSYLKKLPTSFVLKPEQVDQLRDAARRILLDSKDFQRLINDLR
jgi:NTE family protein